MYTTWVYSLVHHPGYIAWYTTLGTPTTLSCTRVYLYLLTWVSRCRMREPWAHLRRSLWVGGLATSQDLKSVRREGRRMRRVTPLSLLGM